MNFVCLQAKMRNDPSFLLTASYNEAPAKNKHQPKTNNKRTVTVLKTGISPNTSSVEPKNKADQAKQYLLYNNPHPPKERPF